MERAAAARKAERRRERAERRRRLFRPLWGTAAVGSGGASSREAKRRWGAWQRLAGRAQSGPRHARGGGGAAMAARRRYGDGAADSPGKTVGEDE